MHAYRHISRAREPAMSVAVATEALVGGLFWVEDMSLTGL